MIVFSRLAVLVYALVYFTGLTTQGQSFLEQPIGSNIGLNSVFMVDTNVGYAGSTKGVFKTLNGGQTWSLLPFFNVSGNTQQDYTTQYLGKLNVHFSNSQTGIAFGTHIFGGEIIFKTINGGTNWSVEHLEVPNTVPPFGVTPPYLKSIHVWDTNRMIIVGNFGRVMSTQDGGDTWIASTVNPDADLLNVQFSSLQEGYTASSSKLYYTSNGGSQWVSRSLPFELNDFHFFNNLHGIAVASNKSFYTTFDGGFTWVEGYLVAEKQIDRLKFFDALTGFAFGFNGLIYKTTDGGNTWLKIFQTQDAITSASLLTSQQIWFSVNQGYLLYSNNGGQISSQTPTISAVTPINTSIGSTITLTGNALSSVIGVRINGVSAFFELVNDVLLIRVGRGTTTGKLEMQWPGGVVTSGFDIIVSQWPQLYTPSPNLIHRGTTSIIQGENLQYLTTLTLGGDNFPFTIIDNQSISFSIPEYFHVSLASLEATSIYGTTSVSLTIGGSPQITNVFYSGAPGQQLTVQGQDFLLIDEVLFGNLPSPSFTILSNTELKCIIPFTASKVIVPIKLVSATRTGISPNDFTIYPAPIITSVGPTSLKSGEELRIEGSFFPRESPEINIGGTKIPFSDIRLVSENLLFVKIPEMMDGNVVVQIKNEGGLQGSTSFSFTSNGRLPFRIDNVTPNPANSTTRVKIQGFFPRVDSLTINGTRQTLDTNGFNEIYFTANPQTTSGRLILYFQGQSLIYEDDLIISEFPSPQFSFTPTEVSVGMRVNVKAINSRYINSIKLNGRHVPFQPPLNISTDLTYSFIVTEDMESGPIKITTIDGTFQSDRILQIKPAQEIKPVIYSASQLPYNSEYTLQIVGDNLSMVTSVRFKEFISTFDIINDDTLLIKFPESISNYYVDGGMVTLVSPAGQASIYSTYSSFPTQVVRSIFPNTDKRGSFITVKLSPQEPYINYPNHYNFIFGETISYNNEKINDSTYLVEVPRTGNVDGKVTVAFNGNFYSGAPFALTTEGYCNCKGTEASTISLKKVKIDQLLVDITSDRYIDNGHISIEAAPGQVLQLGAISSEYHHTNVFIDWNANEEFEELEIPLPGNDVAPPDTMIYSNLIVPSHVLPGSKVKMRFIVNTTPVDDSYPCGLINGQVIDFTIDITAPPAGMKVYDFYPGNGPANTQVTVTGDQLNLLTEVLINGIQVPFTTLNEKTVSLIIPNNIGNGAILFRTSSTEVASSKWFFSSFSPYPSNDTLKQVYRVTINGKDVSFFTQYNPGNNLVEITPIQKFPEDGYLCVYTIHGNFCLKDARFGSIINFPDPFIVKAGEQVTLTGHNLSALTQIMLIPNEPIPFTIIDQNTLTFIPPPSPPTNRVIRFSDNFAIREKEVLYTVDLPVCDPFRLWNEGIEIIQLQFNEINNFSGKNTTGGYSNYSQQLAIVDQYNRYYTKAVVKNFSNEAKNVTIEVHLKDDDGSTPRVGGDYLVGISGGIFLNPGEEAILNPYLQIPDTLEINKQFSLWFIARAYSYTNFCEPRISEIEQYSIVTRNVETPNLLSITGLSETRTSVNKSITIAGTDLTTVKSVQIGNTYSPFTILSSTALQVQVPMGASSGNVKVNSLTSVAESAERLHIVQPHAFTSFEKNFANPGELVKINGSNLHNVTSIRFNGMPISLIWQNSSTIQLKLPSNATSGAFELLNEFDQSVTTTNFYICDGVTPNPFCKANQQIQFGSIGDATFGQTPISFSATVNSGLPITYASSNSSVVTISGNIGTIVGTGTTLITASQPGNTQYNPATDVSINLTVLKAGQTISFMPPADVAITDLPLQLTATASSGLPILYTSTSSVEIIGQNLTTSLPGLINIKANQPGNQNFLPAASVEYSFCILPAKPLISLRETQTGQYELTSSSMTGNQWFKNDIEIGGATNATLVVTESGSYKLKVTAGQCSSAFSEKVDVLITSANDSILPVATLYPNPVGGNLIVALSEPATEISVFNLLGVQLRNIKVVGTDSTYELNLIDLVAGVYIIEIYNQKNVILRQRISKK
ncbi:MAG: IPT/TIG domain-containing protein [Cytophagales bacterium]|nr:IPT/TIG domain-containing protein [Cytophagales bacterium]